MQLVGKKAENTSEGRQFELEKGCLDGPSVSRTLNNIKKKIML